MSLTQKIIIKTGLKGSVVENIIKLLNEGNTIPFIARYRKELTEGASDEQLRDFQVIYTYTLNLENRKADVIRLIDEKGLLTDELKKEIEIADTLARVEDLYRPFKEKKNTKATIAKAKGLEPLAIILGKALLTKEEFLLEAEKYVRITEKKEETVNSIEEAVQGAKDIIAENVSDHANLREKLKINIENKSFLATKPTKKFEKDGVYKIYENYQKKLTDIPSYAYLALCRAEKEKQLNIKFEINEDTFCELAQEYFIPKSSNSSKIFIEEAIVDGLDRLLLPSLQREVRADKKIWADNIAINVFGENLKKMLLTPPCHGKVVLGFDPAYRTGCKLAIVDATGKFIAHEIIYPTPPQNKIEESEERLLQLIKKYKIELIVIGNGTASRESEKFISELLKKYKLKNVLFTIVSEAGASVYSASKLAQEEYPDLDVTIRGAISIAHRIQDPLSELTKIDPKAIGIGQYQHDVDQKLLQEKLDEKIQDTVNAVGVDVNTASYSLLQYIAGLTKKTAINVVNYRDENGIFTSKNQIKKVKGLGAKGYEQCVGFLRIKKGKETLDATGIHPEHHNITYQILKSEFNIEKKKLILPLKLNQLNIKELSNKYEIGYETLEDICKELERPGLDPRDEIQAPIFKSNILEIKDLEIGMQLEGTIRNVTDFGVFIDIGLHSDGFVHKSQIADFFVTNPIEVVSVGQHVKLKVLSIDDKNEKVSLTMKGLNALENKNKSRNKEIFKTNEDKGGIVGNIRFI